MSVTIPIPLFEKFILLIEDKMTTISDQAALRALEVIMTKAKELAPIPSSSRSSTSELLSAEPESSLELEEATELAGNDQQTDVRQVQRRRRRVRNKISKVGSLQSTVFIFYSI